MTSCKYRPVLLSIGLIFLLSGCSVLGGKTSGEATGCPPPRPADEEVAQELVALPYKVPQEIREVVEILEAEEKPHLKEIIEWFKLLDEIGGFEDTWAWLDGIEKLNDQLVVCLDD